MEQRISAGMDHLQRWSRIFRSEETETNFSIWIPTEISGIFGNIKAPFILSFYPFTSAGLIWTCHPPRYKTACISSTVTQYRKCRLSSVGAREASAEVTPVRGGRIWSQVSAETNRLSGKPDTRACSHATENKKKHGPFVTPETNLGND